mmetsp:Transcript_5497/g.11960  ORF Transcript_5497/g.11960 Transcript_5497/m.11960 type:complete len:97 (-) Transcript_5497:248-538(-)
MHGAREKLRERRGELLKEMVDFVLLLSLNAHAQQLCLKQRKLGREDDLERARLCQMYISLVGFNHSCILRRVEMPRLGVGVCGRAPRDEPLQRRAD